MKHWPPKYDIVSSKEKQIEKRQKSSQRSLTHVCPFFTFLKIDRTFARISRCDDRGTRSLSSRHRNIFLPKRDLDPPKYPIFHFTLYSNLLFSYYSTVVRYRSRFPFTVNPKNEKYHAIDTAVQRPSRTPFDRTYPIFLESMPIPIPRYKYKYKFERRELIIQHLTQ